MKILLVEDSPEMRAAARDLLGGLGHDVQTVPAGPEALAVLGEDDGEFDALITDIHLPGITGTQLLLQLLSRGSRLALLAFSSSYSDEMLQHLVDQGRVCFLRKPFSCKSLDQSLEAALRARDRPLRIARPVLAPPRLTPPVPWLRARRWAVITSLAAAAALVCWLLFPKDRLFSREPEPPLPEVSAAVRGEELSLTSPAGALTDFPRSFKWREFPQAAAYNIYILGVDGIPIWNGTTRDTVLPLSSALKAALRRSTVYTWTVEAMDSQSRTLTTSRPLRFLVIPPNTSDERPEDT